jgi:DNA-binding MarR family transcriptional regulator
MSTPSLDEFICFAVYSASHAFNRVYKPLLDRLGLTYPQFLALLCLWRQDGQTVGEIGDQMFLESSTLTPLMKRLEGQGLLTRRRDSADERVVRLFLTPAGLALRDKLGELQACILDASGMELDHLKKLTREVAELRDHLRKPA